MFIIVNVVDLVETYGTQCMHLPRQLKFALLSVCFFAQGLIFYSQLSGKTEKIGLYFRKAFIQI